MTLHSGTGLHGGMIPNCFVHLDGHNRPVYMFGRILRQSAAGRNPVAPACISGFSTDGTPFAKGHIMAVELGGWDNSCNIVPQYENWQGLAGGAWRDMERVIGNNTTYQTMIVKMTYDSMVDSWAVNKARFQGGDTLFHWVDMRIPSRFDVWTLTDTDPGGYFSGTNAFRLQQAVTIVNGLGRADFNFTVDRMPDIDRTLWITRWVRGQVSVMYDDYTVKFEEQKTARLVANIMAAKKGSSEPVKGIKKPTRSSTRTTRSAAGGLVPQRLKNPEWFNTHKFDLVTRIKALPEATAWLPHEKASFDQAILSRMVYG